MPIRWILLKYKEINTKCFVCVESVEGLTANFPKFGFCFPARIFNAVDFPIPLVPTSPSTSPGRGMGNLQA